MKNFALSLFLVFLVAACSSGTTVADLPFNITGLYSGTYQNSTGSRSGTFILNIAEDELGNVTGNLIFGDDDSGCTFNGTIEGSTSGFSIALTLTVSEGTTVEEIAADGSSTITTIDGGGIIYQLTQSNSGNTLSGTYVSTSLPECSNASGSGSVTMNR